jgi:hypothetical protein
MLLWTELLRSVPLPTASLFLKKRDIANGSSSISVDFFIADYYTPSKTEAIRQ